MVKITVSGHTGAGKTTFCRLLSKKLGYSHYYMGGIIRKLAAERGMKTEEFYRELSSDPDLERQLDFYQKKLGEQEDNFIMEGRTSFYFIPNSIKVFLSVHPKVGAERIYREKLGSNERNEVVHGSIEETARANEERVADEKKRYMQLYGIDHRHPQHFDCHIDTTGLAPDEVVEEFLSRYPQLKA